MIRAEGKVKEEKTAVYIQTMETPLGRMIACSDGSGLSGLYFSKQAHFPEGLLTIGTEAELPVFEETREWLREYFAERIPEQMPALCPKGSAYQLRVWDRLRTIPYGETVSYQTIAELAREGNGACSAQAAAQAISRNPISLLVPCHRVIGKDGQLRGYAGGLSRKAFLLELEKRVKQKGKSFDSSGSDGTETFRSARLCCGKKKMAD